MSYALELAAKARGELAMLDVDLQERTYDELELLADDPPLVTPHAKDKTVVHDFIVPRDDGLHYVFIVLRRDDAARLLHVAEVAHYHRPRDSGS